MKSEERLLAFAKLMLWKPIKDFKGIILPDKNSRRLGFEVIFQQGVKEIFHYLSFREKIELFPAFLNNIIQIRKSTKGLKKKPKRDSIEPDELEKIEEYVKKLGASSIGYCKLEREDILEGFGIIYDHAIVFSVEMDKKRISKAPSFPTLKMIYRNYATTGVIANKFAKRLRKIGFGAHAGPGFGGLTIYPVLAEKAGIGTFGRQGIIITPENGPRHRLGVVYTNIINLPETKNEDFSWIKEFCLKCGKCIRKCPAQAIYEKPRITKGNNIAHIDSTKCGDFFARNYSCGICIKECPFNIVGYDKIKKSMIGK